MRVTVLSNYQDNLDNQIEYQGVPIECDIWFAKGARNNKILISKGAKLKKITVQVCCNNATLTIGNVADGKFFIQLGEDCSIHIEDAVTCTGVVHIFTAEYTSVSIGKDVMFATGVRVKTHDHHPIFDVRTKKRINLCKDIVIEDHVWIGDNVYVAKGSTIKEGSIIGYNSFVSGCIPNNCIAGGTPAKVLKRDVAWERPLLNWVEPFYKLDASTVQCSKYWKLTLNTADPSE